MARRPGVETKGAKQLERSLRTLASDASRARVMRPAVRAGVAPMRKAIRARVPVRDGVLKASISSVVRTKRRSSLVTGFVGPRSGMITKKTKRKGVVTERIGQPTKYAHLVEFGTSHSAAKPFMRPGFDASVGEARSLMVAKAKVSLRKEALRARRRT